MAKLQNTKIIVNASARNEDVVESRAQTFGRLLFGIVFNHAGGSECQTAARSPRIPKTSPRLLRRNAAFSLLDFGEFPKINPACTIARGKNCALYFMHSY